jgi:hypothetical protein
MNQSLFSIHPSSLMPEKRPKGFPSPPRDGFGVSWMSWLLIEQGFTQDKRSMKSRDAPKGRDKLFLRVAQSGAAVLIWRGDSRRC